MSERIYLCIDLKSFYASVECVERGFDPLSTNLVVADSSRTEKTICLAVTPSLKALGIPGRARLFEVVEIMKKVNKERKNALPEKRFTAKSCDACELSKNPYLEADYIAAPPRMAYYMEYSVKIYEIYLKYVSSEDILVYSVDEVFIDITSYLSVSKKTPREFAMMLISDVLEQTGITATAGIGTNMFLAKIAMDITAKKMKPDKYGVRIAELNEENYRKELWEHRPLTDFWRVGRGSVKRLEENFIFTMGDIARASLNPYGRKKLKKLFGINAKLLIDHAWGYEPCTISEAKAYIPETKSLSSGQVLQKPYDFSTARIVVGEMLELLSYDLIKKCLLTNQIVLTVGYDIENLADKERKENYKGEIKTDMYGRKVPKPAHGTANIERKTSSTKLITKKTLELYDSIVDKTLTIRRITIAANNLVPETEIEEKKKFEQLDLFDDYEKNSDLQKAETEELEREKKIMQAVISIKERYGKNAVVKGASLQEGATGMERNRQIGGHKA